ncbi:MAG: hypothetical protein ACO3EZ_12100 [Prochlorotrichaceae cyanobacterium]
MLILFSHLQRLGSSARGILPALFTWSTIAMAPAIAEPDPVFTPYLAQIMAEAPPATEVRLPSTVWMGEESQKPSTVQVFSSRTLSLLTLGLSTCEAGVLPCLVGTVTIEPSSTANGQREYQRHRTGFAPITLATGVQGYFLEGSKQRPAVPFSSVMWQQNQTFYTLTFPVNDRQNLLFTARDMANSLPLTP